MLRPGDCELTEWKPLRGAIIAAQRTWVMKTRQGYKGYVIETRSYELRNGRFSAKFPVEEHDASGVTETQFYLPDIFTTRESASRPPFKPDG
jgi:hypothetical protein